MSAVHKYYRKISENVDNIKNSIDIASLLVKSQEVDSKIEVNESNISDNLTKIDNNESNISSNLTKINTNESDISSNLTKINTNESDISSNLTKIDNNESDISSNTSLIDTNSTTLTNIDTDLSNLRSRTNTHQNDIQKLNEKVYYLSDCYKLKDIIIIDIIKSQIAETIDSNNEFVIIQSSLNNLKKDSYLQFDSSILIFFHKHYINIGFFHILLEYFNENDILIESIRMPIIGMISKHTNITNSCIIKIPNDLDKIYYKLSIKLNEGQNRSDLVSIMDFDNKIYFKYFEKII